MADHPNSGGDTDGVRPAVRPGASAAPLGSTPMAAHPDVLAAVDLGTNSLHLVVARVEGSRFEVIEREREMVRLGSASGDGRAAAGDDEMRRLDPAAMDRAID